MIFISFTLPLLLGSLLAAKTYYFGVGGSLRAFEAAVRSDGDFKCKASPQPSYLSLPPPLPPCTHTPRFLHPNFISPLPYNSTTLWLTCLSDLMISACSSMMRVWTEKFWNSHLRDRLRIFKPLNKAGKYNSIAGAYSHSKSSKRGKKKMKLRRKKEEKAKATITTKIQSGTKNEEC